MKMSKIRILMIIGILAIILTIVISFLYEGKRRDAASFGKGVESTGKLDWLNYDTGLQKALSEKKLVMINFYANWCFYCKKMNNETFRNTKVTAYLKENFISIKLNTDKEKKLASEFKVRGLPTIWFLKHNSSPLVHVAGYVPPDRFLNILKDVKAKYEP